MNNLIGPTAQLTEQEAIARAEDLRQQQHMVYGAGQGPAVRRASYIIGESIAEITSDWQSMFYREGQGSID